MPFPEWRPSAISYMYWHEKRSFDLGVDQYESWYLFAVEKGSLSYRLTECKAEGIVRAGDLLLCPPNVQFHRKALEPLCLHVVGLSWRCGQEDHPGKPDDLPSGVLQLRDKGRLDSNFKKMKNSARAWSDHPNEWVRYFVEDIWMTYVWETTYLNSVEDQAMNQAAKLMERYAWGNCSIERLSQEVHLSTAQFNRRFQAAFGQSPHERLTSIRLERACSLLRTSAMTLEEIALACGYNNGAYLSRVFRNKLGATPSQYRQKQRM